MIIESFFSLQALFGLGIGIPFLSRPFFLSYPTSTCTKKFLFSYFFFNIYLIFLNLGIRDITQKPTRGMKMVGKYSSWLGGGCLRSDPLLSFYWPTWNFGFTSGHASGGFSLYRRHVRSYNCIL